jgi:hypothetical protein
MTTRMPFLILMALGLGGTACSRESSHANCDLLIEGIVNSEAVKQSPNPVEASLLAIQEKGPEECDARDPTFVGAKAYFLYGLGRISESEQLMLQLDWRTSNKPIVLRAAVILIVHERRLGNDLSVAEELARRVVGILPLDPKSHLLIGEVLIAQGRHGEAVAAYDEAKSARAAGGLRKVNGFDLNFIPSLFEQERYEDVLEVFNATRETPSFGVWERETLVLAGLYSAETLGRQRDVLSIVEETERRRPDIASSVDFQDLKRRALSMETAQASDAEDEWAESDRRQ